jgi:adenylate cyclase
VGSAAKRDFTILGNTVNRTARLESMTRDLNVRLAIDSSVLRRAARSWPFVSLGKQNLKGQSRAIEVFGIRTLSRLDVPSLYERIRTHVRQRHR